MKRKRLLYAGLILATIATGLASRLPFAPHFVYSYLGDVLYAIMIFFIIGFLSPRLSTFKAFFVCILICYSIELSQLIQVTWLNEIRGSRLGGLVLGRGFLWSDILSYTLGGLIATGIEIGFLTKWDI